MYPRIVFAWPYFVFDASSPFPISVSITFGYGDVTVRDLAVTFLQINFSSTCSVLKTSLYPLRAHFCIIVSLLP